MSKHSSFKFVQFSKKQRKVLTWWMPESPMCQKDAIVCDGSVRAGKTLIMSLSYILWAMESFRACNFGMAGKTIGSFKRNVWITLRIILFGRGYKVAKVPDADSNSAYRISKGNVHNYFYIFGGKDERSQDLVQGFTAAGFFFDEVTLQPRTFVNQAIARCSVEGAKLWFNCNPDGPYHWFKQEWIDGIEGMNAFRIHFNMDDNPSLSEAVKERYKRMFSGVFYERFILGLWVLAEGVIYSMFRKEQVVNKVTLGVKIVKKWIGVDYGQSNATVFLLCGLGDDNRLYILDTYYHEGKTSHVQKSPSKYSKDYFKWKIKNGVEGMPVVVSKTYIDPSAKGFMMQLHEDGERNVWQADNEVLKGIELISSMFDNDMIRILSHNVDIIMELGAYRWDPKAQARGEDKPIKQYDHALDALRYIVNCNRMLFLRLVKDFAAKEVA